MVQMMLQRQRFDPGGSKASDMWSPKRREPDAQVVSQNALVKPSSRWLTEPHGNTFGPPPGSPMNKIIIEDADYDSRHAGEEKRVDEDNRDFQQQASCEADASIIDLTHRDEVCMDPPAANETPATPWFGFDWTTASATIGEAFSNLTDTNKSLKRSTSKSSQDESKIDAATEEANLLANTMTQQTDEVHSPLTALRKRLQERVQLKGSLHLPLPVLVSEEFTSSIEEKKLPDLCGEESNDDESPEFEEVGSVECEIVDGKVTTKPVSSSKVETVVSDEGMINLSSPARALMKNKSDGDYGSQTSWEQPQEDNESIGDASWERSRSGIKDYGQVSPSLGVDAAGLTFASLSKERDNANNAFEQDESIVYEEPSIVTAKCDDLTNYEVEQQANYERVTPAQGTFNTKNENTLSAVIEKNTTTGDKEQTSDKDPQILVKQTSMAHPGTPGSNADNLSPEATHCEESPTIDGSACGRFFCFPEFTALTVEKEVKHEDTVEKPVRNQELESFPVRSVLSSLFQCVDPLPSTKATIKKAEVEASLTVDKPVSSKDTTDKVCEIVDDEDEENDEEDPSMLLSTTGDLKSLPSVEEDVNDTVLPYQAGDFGQSPKANSADIVESNIKKLDQNIEIASTKSVPSCGSNGVHTDLNDVVSTSVKSAVGRFFNNSIIKSVCSGELSVGEASAKSNRLAGHSIGEPSLKSNQAADSISPKSVHSAETSEVKSQYSDAPSDGRGSPTSSQNGAASAKSTPTNNLSLKLMEVDDDTYVTEFSSLDASMETRRATLIKELRSAISTYGRYDVRCADISAALGDLLVEGKEYNHAIKLHRDSVTIYSCKLGDDHTTTLNAKTRLAAVLESAGEIEEAIMIYFQITSMRRAVLGDQDPSVADGLVCLAHALRMNSDYVPAIKELKRALKIFRESLGDSHEKVASTVDEIASLYVTIGDFTKSAAILEEVVKLKAATMGAKSKEVAATLVQLANAYECSDKFDSAMKALKKAYKIYTEIVGYSSEEAAATLNRMAQLYEATDDYNRASVAYLGVLRGRKIQRGPDDFSVGETYFHLARALRETKQYEKALKCLKEALPIFVGQGVEMNDVKMVADIMHEMALVSLERGHFQDASRILKQELSVRRKVGQPEFPFAARTLKHLGVTEYTMKNHSKALKYLVEALSIHQEREDQGVECAEVLFHTGLVFYKVNNKERALEAFVEAVRIFNEHGLDNYPLNIEANEKIEDIRADMETAHTSLPRRFNFAKRFGGKH